MADKLVALTFLLLFIGFRPTISDEVLNQEATGEVPVNNDLSPAFKPGSYFHNSVENSVSKDKSVKEAQDHQHVEEESTADDNSEDSEDQAPSAETAESKGSPGFFSQVLSELTAPFNEEDEQDFLSEDNDSENPSLDDQIGDDDPEDKSDETSNDEGDKPDFATLPFAKSVTENVNSARTADKRVPVEGDSDGDTNQELEQDSAVKSAHGGNESSVEETSRNEKETAIKEETNESEDHMEDKPKSVEKDLNKKEIPESDHKLESDASELSDDDLEHLRVKSKLPKEEGISDALKEEDLIEKRKEELMEQELEEQTRKVLFEKENKIAEEEKQRKEKLEKQELEEQKRKALLEKEKRLKEEEKWRKEKQELEEQKRKAMLEKERTLAEEEKVRKEKQELEELKRKAKLEKERRLAEEEKQRKEEEARLRLESLKQQRKQIEENERVEAERLRLEKVQKERDRSAKKQNGAKRKDQAAKEPSEKVPQRNNKLQDNERVIQDKGKLSQEKGKGNKRVDEDEEHIKLKGAFDRKIAEEEAALKRKLEKLNEERRNFEKMAEEYRISKQERQRKQQKEKDPTKRSHEEDGSGMAATTVSPPSKQQETLQQQGKSDLNVHHESPDKQTLNVQTSHPKKVTERHVEPTASFSIDAAKATAQTATGQTVGVSATKAGDAGGGTTTAVPGTLTGTADEEVAVKKAVTEAESRPDKSFERTTTSDKEPLDGPTKEEIQATATVAAETMTEVKDEDFQSAVDLKTNDATTDHGKKTEQLDESCLEGVCHAKPKVLSLASRFQKVQSSVTSTVVLGEAQFSNIKENASQVNGTLSGYANFMRAFRNFHEKSVHCVFSYWPAAKNTTRDLLAYVRLDGAFEQLCNDLTDVHPAVLFVTFLVGTLGFLYFFWSITFGRMRHGAQGPSPHDVLRSYEARARILEEEVKSLEAEKLKIDMDRNNVYKEKLISEEQLRNTNETIQKLTKTVEKLMKEKQEVQTLVKEMGDNGKKLAAESKEKDEQIVGCENMISDLKTKIEAKEGEIQKLNDHFQKQEVEKQVDKKHIEELDEKIQEAEVEKQKLEHLLTETKEKKQSLQVEFDDQLLRLTDLQEQNEFRRNEVEVLKDCLKQIKLETEGEEEPDEDEMAGRLQNLMNVDEVKAENKKLQEKLNELETEAEELRKTRKMLENDNAEKTERLEQAESKSSQAMLTQREKEIELVALQKYFKSTEVELHRKITTEESTRISIENQLQSEQAKASTAVVDADKYRQLYLDIKKQIEEIDESKKEQLSNMEKKAHQNWLDYRAAVRELDGLKDENELLRRKLYDLEVRGSRPSSSASSQLNHVDGRDSPSRRSPMSGPPGHGSPVPFGAPPMMGPPPPPPPSSMFPGQRRPHPADMLGMTPPRPPFPPPGPVTRGHPTPPPTTGSSTHQSSKTDDRLNSFVQDSNDGSPHPPPPPMSGYGPPPRPPMMRMPMFSPRPMMPPPPTGPLPPMFLPRPGGHMPPPPPQGPRPQASSTPNRS